MAQKQEVRRCLFGSPTMGFSGGFPTEADIFRVFMWCENQSKEGSSPTSILEEVTIQLRAHWDSLGKVVQKSKDVKGRINTLVKKAKKYDNCVHLLTNPTLVHQKKALFARVVDIELKNRTNPDVAKVRKSSKAHTSKFKGHILVIWKFSTFKRRLINMCLSLPQLKLAGSPFIISGAKISPEPKAEL